MIVTIDGPAGSGKSTAARGLAERLGFRFLDTGAMYRAVGWACVTNDVDANDAARVAAIARDGEVTFDNGRIFWNGEDITDHIRTEEVTHAASLVAINPDVRDAMARLQRREAEAANIVTEGRDQGTHVFPNAKCKFFLTADAAKRADRRRDDMRAAGKEISADEMQAQLRDRDDRDSQRAVAPLKPADDAIVIDTSAMTVEQMLDELERRVRACQAT